MGTERKDHNHDTTRHSPATCIIRMEEEEEEEEEEEDQETCKTTEGR